MDELLIENGKRGMDFQDVAGCAPVLERRFSERLRNMSRGQRT
jgi:hypothetical protein